MMSDKAAPLNLDLTCLKVNSSLEDSLGVAAAVLSLVKSVQPTIITIQDTPYLQIKTMKYLYKIISISIIICKIHTSVLLYRCGCSAW